MKLILEDPESCAKSGAFESAAAHTRTKTIQACKPFYHNLIGLNGWHEQDNAKGVIAHEIGHLDDSLSLWQPVFLRWKEILADLYTLRNPQRSRGLRNDFVKLAKMIPLEVEIAQHREEHEFDVHPYNFERIRYLTEGLCALYPEKNQDIC